MILSLKSIISELPSRFIILAKAEILNNQPHNTLQTGFPLSREWQNGKFFNRIIDLE